MSEDLSDSNARLQQLLEQAMNETDPEKCDALYTEIKQELQKRDATRKALKAETTSND